ncbi:RNase H domain-containing protein [Trichonephila clavipes]|nr:RNase H domain-containing protein [Trichonephila clavipes]
MFISVFNQFYCTIHGKRCHILQEVGLLPVGPRKVFYFPSTTHWKPMEAFPYPPPGDAPSRGYRLPRDNFQDNFAIAYTDGSSDRSLSNGGAGIILLLPDGNNYKHKINTGIIASNFTSELVAIREALLLYQQNPHVIDSTEGLVIFSDSKSAIEAIRNGETNISCDIITLLEQLHCKRKSCILQWIPAHVNIEGNECADLSLSQCASPKKLETSNISAPPSHLMMLMQ